VSDKTKSLDSVIKRSGDRFMDPVKSTYRVLLMRRMKGCRVVILDGATRDNVRSRL
jgi:uncharacterized protein